MKNKIWIDIELKPTQSLQKRWGWEAFWLLFFTLGAFGNFWAAYHAFLRGSRAVFFWALMSGAACTYVAARTFPKMVLAFRRR